MANQIKPLSLVFFFSFAIFLVGNSQHALWDRDEPRYAVATREMILSGDWIIPHFNGEIRYDKPILTYWLMAGPMKMFGMNEFGARFASAIMGAFRVALVFLFALALGAERRGALLAAMLAALIPLLLMVSKAATTDATLVLTVTAAMYLFWQQDARGFSPWRHLGFWAALALSALVKGPVGIAVVMLAILTFRGWNWLGVRQGWFQPRRESMRFADWALHFLSGIVIFLIICLPWALPAWLRTDGDFFLHSISVHVVGRVSEPMEGHGGMIFYYLPVMLVALLPFTPIAINAAVHGWSNRRQREMRLLWSWIVPGFVMFSLSSTKLPHYIAPLLPAVALMCGLWWTQHGKSNEDRHLKRGWWLAGGVLVLLAGVGIAIGLPIAAKVIDLPSGLLPVSVVSGLLGVSFVAGAVAWMMRKADRAFLLWTSGLISGLLFALLWALPVADALRPSKPAGLWLRENAPKGTRRLMVEFDEPSVVFYGGGYFRTVGTGDRREGFAMLNQTDVPTAMVTTAERWRKFRNEYQGWVSPKVSVRFEKESYYFEGGDPMTVVVVGNW